MNLNSGPGYDPTEWVRLVNYYVPALARPDLTSHHYTTKARGQSLLDKNRTPLSYLISSRVRAEGHSAHVGELVSAAGPRGPGCSDDMATR